AQRMRRQRMVVYNRGNRDWYSREKSAHVVRVAKGQSWTMPFTLDLAGDLATVGAFVSIKTNEPAGLNATHTLTHDPPRYRRARACTRCRLRPQATGRDHTA